MTLYGVADNRSPWPSSFAAFCIVEKQTGPEEEEDAGSRLLRSASSAASSTIAAPTFGWTSKPTSVLSRWAWFAAEAVAELVEVDAEW